MTMPLASIRSTNCVINILLKFFFIHQEKTDEHDTKCKEFEDLSTRCDGEMKELNEQINTLHQVCHYKQFS